MAISLTGRDDSDDIAFRSEAVADHESSQAAAQARQDKSVFLFRVVRVVYELAVLVREDCLRVLKAHPLLAQVCSRLLADSTRIEASTKCTHHVHTVQDWHGMVFVRSNVRAKRATTANHQSRASNAVQRTTGPSLVTCPSAASRTGCEETFHLLATASMRQDCWCSKSSISSR